MGMSYDIDEIRQSPRQFVDLETVEWLGDRVITLEQQLAAKDALLRQARDALRDWETCDLSEDQCDVVLTAIDKELGK
jgi:hypothetical protein